jgi:hypothetical protein
MHLEAPTSTNHPIQFVSDINLKSTQTTHLANLSKISENFSLIKSDLIQKNRKKLLYFYDQTKKIVIKNLNFNHKI